MNEFPLNPSLPDPLEAGAALDLTRAILARTSGSPCARVEDLACEYVDGQLAEAQRGLVGAHLEHCAACAQLVTALARATALLPRMAEADPGPWFTARVLRATVHAPRPTYGERAFWTQLLHRPRIALEAAYLGTALGFMGLALPMPISLVRALSPAPLVAPLKAPAERVLGKLVAAEQRTVASVGRGLKWSAGTSAGEVPTGTLWQRSSRRVRGWLQALKRAPKEKSTPSANP